MVRFLGKCDVILRGAQTKYTTFTSGIYGVFRYSYVTSAKANLFMNFRQ